MQRRYGFGRKGQEEGKEHDTPKSASFNWKFGLFYVLTIAVIAYNIGLLVKHGMAVIWHYHVVGTSGKNGIGVCQERSSSTIFNVH